METSKKILALDSSGLVASVAVVEGNSTYSNLLDTTAICWQSIQ